MVVVGGAGSITGAFIAAIIFSVLTEIFRPLEENLNVYGIGEIFTAVILILILIYRPQGLFGSHEPEFLSRRGTQ
jgi:branched-chain amino acid transport system permease protein